MVEKQSDGYERHYVKLVDEKTKELRGLALFNVDYTAQNEFRVYVRHISSLDFNQIAKAVEQVMQFVWTKLDCQNVRVEIYHFKDEATGKVQADPDVKNAFTKSGFKWKTLSNDPATGKRA